MARREPAAGVAGLHPGAAAPGVRDEPPAPRGQRHVAARLRRADGAERSGGGRMQITVLAAQIGWERSRVSHHVRRMTARGLVTCGLSAADRRVTEVTLTAQGRQALEEAAPGHVDLVPAPVLRGTAGRPGGAAQRGTGKRVRQHHQTGLAPAAGRLAPGGGLTRPCPCPPSRAGRQWRRQSRCRRPPGLDGRRAQPRHRKPAEAGIRAAAGAVTGNPAAVPRPGACEPDSSSTAPSARSPRLSPGSRGSTVPAKRREAPAPARGCPR